MGKRDYRHREPKKTKKEAKKLPQVPILETPAQVEVIKKRKKGREAEEEEE
jgi:hypothetical protein